MATPFESSIRSVVDRLSAWRREREALRDAREFWEEGPPLEGENRFWGAQPLVRRVINRRVTGDPNRWPLEWFRDRYAREPLPRGLSIGCGSGALERDVLAKGICREMEGIDFSREAVAEAQREGRERGLRSLAYRTGDINRLSLPARHYDAVFFHGSLHHVRQLERVLDAVHRALRPGGMIYIDEYTGPARDEWTDEKWRFAKAAFEALPEPLKNRPQLMIPLPLDDPLESVRSSAIPTLLRERFRILEDRPYGGDILWFIFPCLDMKELLRDRTGALSRLIALEEHLLEQAWLESYFRVMVGRKER
jgi:SAM-dependent methyltransferase